MSIRVVIPECIADRHESFDDFSGMRRFFLPLSSVSMGYIVKLGVSWVVLHSTFLAAHRFAVPNERIQKNEVQIQMARGNDFLDGLSINAQLLRKWPTTDVLQRYFRICLSSAVLQRFQATPAILWGLRHFGCLAIRICSICHLSRCCCSQFRSYAHF